MSIRWMGRVVAVATVLAGLCAQAADAAAHPVYLALGDSLAYGMQIGRLKQQIQDGQVDAAAFDTGYAYRLAEQLQPAIDALQLIDLGCPGETSSSFVHGPCAYATSGKPFGDTPLPLHTAYTGAQLQAALDYLKNPQYDVRLVTIDIGVNDLRAAELACSAAADFQSCLRPRWALQREQLVRNLDAILSQLRSAAPRTPIAVVGYYNWLALQQPSTNLQVQQLNASIARAARRVGAIVVPTFASFSAQGKLCDLSLVCGPIKDLHPSDAGYQLIADLIHRRIRRQIH